MRSTTQIWEVTRQQYGISVLVSQTSFRGVDYIIPSIHHSSRTIGAQEIARLLYNIYVFI